MTKVNVIRAAGTVGATEGYNIAWDDFPNEAGDFGHEQPMSPASTPLSPSGRHLAIQRSQPTPTEVVRAAREPYSGLGLGALAPPPVFH
jgi:hypothetical protein